MTIASARTSGAGPRKVARMRQDEARIWEDLGSSGEALGVPVASARTSGAGPETESGSALGVVREWSGSALGVVLECSGSFLRGSWEEWQSEEDHAVSHRTQEGVCSKQTPSRPPSQGAAMLNYCIN